MLQLPNLDDRSFKQIVEEARKRIPILTEEWTDQNAHDPGITLIELFSWLAEMQQYYLDQVTQQNELKFLKLLNIYPQPARSARVELSFSILNEQQKIFVPQGTPVSAQGQVFESHEAQWILANQIEKVLVLDRGEVVDFSAANEHVGPTYYAFGPSAERGNRLYLAFERELPIDEDFALSCSLFENYPVSLYKDKDTLQCVIPSAQVKWYYYGEDDDQEAGGWLPIKINKDETLHFSYSGLINMSLPTRMKATTVYPATDKKRFWLYAQVEQEGYELPPKVDKIDLNTVWARQIQTMSQMQAFSSDGSARQEIVVQRYLDLYGHLLVQVGDKEQGWQDWNLVEDLSLATSEELAYSLQRDFISGQAVIRFGDGVNGRIPPSGRENIRVISYTPAFEAARWLGASNGLPYQRFELPVELLSSPELQDIQLQVGIRDSEGSWLWQDWHKVDNFDRSQAEDRHFTVQLDSRTVTFGNHEQGIIPPQCDIENIRIISLQYGGGERGNVKSQVIDQLVHSFQGLSVINYYDAAGGSERETLEEAKGRLLHSLNKPTRMVTNADCEQLARATPGVRVARVKALSLYEPGLRDYPSERAEGKITVVAVPYSEAERPIPSPGFLYTIKKHLEQYRLITTEIHVIAPEYIKVTVFAAIVVEPEVRNHQQLVELLNSYLSPLDCNGSKGWDFGKTVFKGDVMAALNQHLGVVYIQDLWMDGEGKGMQKDEKGNILLPPHGLVYSGKHQITLVSRADL